jgi:hypothetical protein
MSATFGFNDIRVRPTGYRVEVPQNDIARLMYYLSCVDTVINYGKEDMYTDYEHYYLLTGPERIELIKLVTLFNPKFFTDVGIFIVDPNLVPDDMCNQFYEITDERIGLHLDEEIMIGGRSVKVLKVMACKTSWLYTYYINPLKNILKPPPPPPPKTDYKPIPPRREKKVEPCCSIF